MVKVCAISDVHGQWSSVNIEPCDILFIGGDIVPLKMQRNVPQSFSWFEKKFINGVKLNQLIKFIWWLAIMISF